MKNGHNQSLLNNCENCAGLLVSRELITNNRYGNACFLGYNEQRYDTAVVGF
jgi:hypothetical protein